MGIDRDFVFGLIDTYAQSPEPVYLVKLRGLRRALGGYNLSIAERAEIENFINNEQLENASTEHEPSERAAKDLISARGIMPEEERVEKWQEVVGKHDRAKISKSNEAKIVELLRSFHTNPNGIADLVEDGLKPEMKAKFAQLIKERMAKHGAIEAVDWGSHVASFIADCENKGGTVMFRTRYAGERFEDFEHPGRYLVLGICYGKHESQWFKNVELDDVKRLEED